MLGVASAALWAAGCTWPKPSATPISRWEFDETSSAEGVFEDRGPAHVLMLHAGTWVDLTTDPLVAGDDGTSAYTDGSAYATIPADVPAYNLAAITISFYYQRESASEKHILLAGGNGSQAGDFSIEVLPNGRLRGWHTGQDNQLRFFESTNGITGTDLQVGTAHRIDLSLGAQGARLYLDGAELASAAIPANTNGWNNSRVKFLGRWTDGVQAPAIGVFDRLRIWNRQLTGAEIAELEAAQSITLPSEEPGEPGDALTVPSLAEWLVSDEPDPTPTKYVSNQNRGNGSGSSAANAQEVQAALNGASPGQTFVAVCQTPGTIEFWNYPNGLTFPSGTSGNFITLQARNGDGVVISRGEVFAGARTPNNGFWTQSGLSSDDISKDIWRSVSTFSGGEEVMLGWWIEFDHPHQLLRYSNMTNLRAAYGSGDSPTNYATPGVHKASDGRVYIRMQKPHPSKYSVGSKWSESLWQGHPEAVTSGQLDYPKSQDPNDYPIYLTRVTAQTSAFSFASGGWAKVGAGINSMGHAFAFNRGSHNIWCDRGTHYTWFCCIRPSVITARVDDYFMNRVRCTDGSKRHASRSEWKFGGPSEGIRSVCFGTNSGQHDSMSGVYWKDCTIADYHELCVYARNVSDHAQVRMRNCMIFNLLDDGFQVRYSMSRVEIGYCFFYNADWGGPGSTDSDGQDPDPGEWYVHHNIFDWRVERCSDWREQAAPQDIYTAHSPDGDSPRKIYNNLVISAPDRQGTASGQEGVGFEHCASTGNGGTPNNLLSGAANTHQVFNNIILQVHIEGTKRYDANVRSDFIGCHKTRYSANETNELTDYNLYWRPSTMNTEAALYYVRGNQTSRVGYASLAAWWASAEFTHSKQTGSLRGPYSPGVDGNSTMTKPTMGTIDNFPAERLTGYRPAATSAVTVASSGSLNGREWWSTPPTWGTTFFSWSEGGLTLQPSAYKGPLDPNGSTMPVGVQNP